MKNSHGYFIIDPRSPDAPEPAEVHICSACEEPIYAGDECYELDNEYYHIECFEEEAVSLLVEKFDAVKSIAEEGEYDEYYDRY